MAKIRVRPGKSCRTRKVVLLVPLLLVFLSVSGCREVRFYTQAARGQYQLLTAARPIEKVLKDPTTSPELAQRLRLVNELREFADKEMRLPVDAHYRKYADLHRPYAVWNVEAAPEFSMEPKRWWYPLVGRLDYRGYFARENAEEYGRFLEHQGYDVYVGGASAYSTLGWFKDPVLNTFLFDSDAELAETLFHELAHQQVFARGDTDFNEAFATTVGQEATRRWLKARLTPADLLQYEQYVRRNAQFVEIVMKARERLETVYGDVRDANGKIHSRAGGPLLPVGEGRVQKAHVLEELQRDYAALKANWGGDALYDRWLERGVNNAKLNSIATYYDLVPRFERLLELSQGDVVRFYTAAERLAKMDKKDRHEQLRVLVQAPTLPAGS